MAKFAVIVALFGLCLVPSLAYNSRIVGGKDATNAQFPHQISLRRPSSHTCGGSIVSQTMILTAAHCVVDGSNKPYAASTFTIVAGSNTLNSGGVSRTGKRVIVHEGYGGGTFMNDVALIELSSPLSYTSAIQPIALATSAPPSGAAITISGWGRIATGGAIPNALKYNTLTATSASQCAVNGRSAGLLCLAHSSGNGACNGDSGGPAIYGGKIVGIANFVMGGCGSSNPDGYASVAYFYNWIAARI